MNRFMTCSEIKAQFPSEIVLVEDVKLNQSLEVEGGIVLWHSKDRDEVYAKIIELRPKRFALLYNSKVPEDIVYAL